jgi:hypothetical protein
MVYVPRRPRSFRYKKKSSSPSKGTRRPARYAPKSAVRTYKRNRKIANYTSNLAEHKILPLSTYRDIKPVSINGTITGNHTTSICLVTGQIPSTWSGPTNSFTNLGGFSAPKGTASNERVGNYMFFNKTTMNLNLKMKALENTDFNGAVKFRMMVFRERRRSHPSGIGQNPLGTLFVDPAGDKFGSYSSSLISGADIWQSLPNKRDWVILQDKKFILQSPSIYSVNPGDTRVVNNTKYSSERNMMIHLPHFKKVKFTDADKPDNLDYVYGVVIYATYMGATVTSTNICNDWVLDVQGATSCLDN